MAADPRETSVVVVGGGFAGLACARRLARQHVHVTLVDRNNYNQFQPMLYQLATAQVTVLDVAEPLRGVFRKHKTVDVKMASVTRADPETRTVECSDGTTFSGDYLVLAMGAQPNFFHTPGADTHAFPLYSLDDAQRLRSRLFEIFEEADRNPKLVDEGVLNIVVVGGGATGVETAGAVADLINHVMPGRFHDMEPSTARVLLVDPASVVLAPFSERMHEYAKRVLERKRVELRLGLRVTDVRPDRVVLSDGSEIMTRAVIWAGGIQAAALAGDAGLQCGAGGRIDVDDDLTAKGFPRVYALGDVANTPGPDGKPFPQLGSVALQAGRWAADNIVADIEGRARQPFHYRDKGIMAMIGTDAAVAEMGKRRRELKGPLAFLAWLAVHAWLLDGFRQRVDAMRSWAWAYLSRSRAASIIDRPSAARIDWVDLRAHETAASENARAPVSDG
jgi:NADH:quinone reductase (non-electrogenic)